MARTEGAAGQPCAFIVDITVLCHGWEGQTYLKYPKGRPPTIVEVLTVDTTGEPAHWTHIPLNGGGADALVEDVAFRTLAIGLGIEARDLARLIMSQR